MQPVDPNVPPLLGVHRPPNRPLAEAGQPPGKYPREKPEKLHEKTYTAGPKLLLSLIVLAPRLAIGTAYLTSATVKGVISAMAIAGAKSGVFRGRTDTVRDFAGASFRDARRDFSKAILLAFASILAPLGHLHALWDEHENDGLPTEFTGENLGSLGPKKFVRQYAVIFQMIVEGKDPPEPSTHTWKKIETKLDAVADFVTHYRGIHKAMNKFRESVHMDLRPPTSPEGGP